MTMCKYYIAGYHVMGEPFLHGCGLLGEEVVEACPCKGQPDDTGCEDFAPRREFDSRAEAEITSALSQVERLLRLLEEGKTPCDLRLANARHHLDILRGFFPVE